MTKCKVGTRNRREILYYFSTFHRSTPKNLKSNGIVTYEQATEAIRLHEVAYNNKDRFFGEKGQEYDDLTFKNACEGSRAVNIEYRYEILSEIIQEVTSNVYSNEASPLERV